MIFPLKPQFMGDFPARHVRRHRLSTPCSDFSRDDPKKPGAASPSNSVPRKRCDEIRLETMWCSNLPYTWYVHRDVCVMYILNDINDDINVTHIDIEIHQPICAFLLHFNGQLMALLVVHRKRVLVAKVWTLPQKNLALSRTINSFGISLGSIWK